MIPPCRRETCPNTGERQKREIEEEEEEEEEEEGLTLNRDGVSVGKRNGFRLALSADRWTDETSIGNHDYTS